jgi:hypothetical protein
MIEIRGNWINVKINAKESKTHLLVSIYEVSSPP